MRRSFSLAAALVAATFTVNARAQEPADPPPSDAAAQPVSAEAAASATPSDPGAVNESAAAPVSAAPEAASDSAGAAAGDDLYAPIDRSGTSAEAPSAAETPAASAGDDLYAPIELGEPEIGDPKYIPPELTADAAEAGGSGLDLSGLDLDFGGRLEGNLHYRAENKSTGPYYDRVLQEEGIARYETTFNFKLKAAMDRFVGVADVDLDLLGYGDERYGEFEDLLRWEDQFPVRLEVNSAYLEATDLFIDGLDLRFGQQIVKFGVGDQFNPTDNLNPEDLENVLNFGKQLGNFMLRVDYGFLDNWSVTAVAVPVFRPSILPHSALAGITAVDRLPFVDESTRLLLHTERDFARDFLGYPTTVSDIQYQLPKFNIENFQWYGRVGGELFGQDVALSYYYGRVDMPQTVSNHSSLLDDEHCWGVDDTDCFAGWLQTNVTMAYPRMQVVGLNVAGELPLGIGYRIEAGLYIPGQRRAKLTNDQLSWLADAGEYEYVTPDGYAPVVIEGDPYAKWVVGLDYTFGKHFYLNAMWVHGFADEFGGGDFYTGGASVRSGGTDSTLTTDDVSQECVLRYAYYADETKSGERCAWEIRRSTVGDYLVLGIDFKFNEGAGLIRLFTIFDLTGYSYHFWNADAEERVEENWDFFSEDGFSAVLYPEFNYNFGNGLELGGGTLIQLGKRHTKFGDPAAGGTLVFVKGKYSF